MKNPKSIFIFLTGLLFMHLIGHVWLELDGLLPITSNILDHTLTPEANRIVIAVNVVLLLLFAHFAFSHDWTPKGKKHPHAESPMTVDRTTIVLLAGILMLGSGAVTQVFAQCVDDTRGIGSRLVFDNASSYTSTFFLDDVEITTLTPYSTSQPITVSSGSHLLGARAMTFYGDL